MAGTRKLGRATSHRLAMLKSLTTSLLLNGKIETTEAKAKEVLALYEGGAKTREAFEALGKEHTEDSSVFYEDVYEGQMVEEFEDWLFDKNRKEGDTGIVKTTYGYHVMYYVGEAEDAKWMTDAENSLKNEDYTEAKDAVAEKFPITVGEEKLFKKVKQAGT